MNSCINSSTRLLLSVLQHANYDVIHKAAVLEIERERERERDGQNYIGTLRKYDQRRL